MSDVEEVLKVIRLQEAATARGDAEAVVSANAAGIVLYDMPPPLAIKGSIEEGIEGLNGWFDTWEDGVTVSLDDPTVIVDGDLAVVYGLSQMLGIKKDAGPLDAWNRRTVVLKREEGRWKIVHEHSSYPTAMDGSLKSLTDLKPE